MPTVTRYFVPLTSVFTLVPSGASPYSSSAALRAAATHGSELNASPALGTDDSSAEPSGPAQPTMTKKEAEVSAAANGSKFIMAPVRARSLGARALRNVNAITPPLQITTIVALVWNRR